MTDDDDVPDVMNDAVLDDAISDGAAGTPEPAAARGPSRPRTPAETLVAARRLYETTTLTQVEIARRLNMPAPSLCRMAKRDSWVRPQETERRRRLLADVRAKVDGEMAATERLFGAQDLAGEEAARAARTLTSLVRALRELQKFDDEQGRAGRREDADDACPDIDEFRRDIARRLARMRPADP